MENNINTTNPAAEGKEQNAKRNPIARFFSTANKKRNCCLQSDGWFYNYIIAQPPEICNSFTETVIIFGRVPDYSVVSSVLLRRMRMNNEPCKCQ